MKEKLYLPLEGKYPTRQTQTILFLCQYCGYDSFDVSLVQTAAEGKLNHKEEHTDLHKVASAPKSTCQSQGLCLFQSCGTDTSVGQFADDGPTDSNTVEVPSVGRANVVDGPSSGCAGQDSESALRFDQPKANTSCAGFSEWLPQDFCCTLKNFQDIDWLAQQCQLPAVIGSGGLTSYSGLCAVLRRIVKKAHEKHPAKELEALLGFNQACLKKCSEVSPWTKLCEVDIYQDLTVNGSIPAAILELEKQLASPVVISSKLLRKMKVKQTRDCQQNQKVEQGKILESESVFHTSTMHLLDKNQIRIAKCLYKDQLNSNLNSFSNDRAEEVKQSDCVTLHKDGLVKAQDARNKVPLNKTKTTYQAKSAASKRSTTSPCEEKSNTMGESVAHPQHLFAEGPYVTLCDFALFYSMHSFHQNCVEKGKSPILFWDIPFVCRWYQRMWSVPNLRVCAERCGLNEVVIPEEVIQSGCSAKVKTEVKDEVKSGNTTDKTTEGNTKSLQISQLPSVRDRVAEIISKLEGCGIQITVDDLPVENVQLPWDTFPESVNPSKDVSEERARHKRQQIESIVAPVKMIAKPGDVIVDFCSGGGHVGIVLAHCLPDCHIIMVESNEESMKRAEARIQGTRLNNISFCQCNLNYFTGTFDIGVSLHACGVATDLVLGKCLTSRASFVCSPCCYGSARDSHLIKYPRSKQFLESPVTYEDYQLAGHVAEQTSRNFESKMAKQAKVCMSILDTDRAEAARELDYQVGLYSLRPASCSPKNNLLIGTPSVGSNRFLL
ncbi:glutathione S-transferase C-terminal domain-containing protein-like [Patiria miniata]|uniref:Methyltransferase domain-containing protein n=1 Tax=Patiria miniata TaxID=46514 RepID=A0A913ZZP1_PATMI|nr:glutathione S-transferase C-terminal domain-containing protein-like [Patiria miniata]XP_038056800.1 glutathione S-transferase C-terminal domain-containing protein-like [Patiria miniata]XP_038056801.1 glutathione S-transferase C-terminal domain-containing protein-like [Patiria miniata]XP_038056802.1 glutathione S-transferase C-terminal domain-containing protein-like [Patiria miniata]XP_038056803.1 glutathione S-transferase C-terminal domain-containing protein-like [Patiria miniata]